MPPPDLSPTSAAPIADVDRILSQIREAVAKLPLAASVDSVKFPGGPQLKDEDEMGVQARHLIKCLAVLARLGRTGAVRALRDIGNLAAEELDELMASASAIAGERASSRTGVTPPWPAPGYEHPVLEFRTGLDPIRAILQTEEETIANLSPAAIYTWVAESGLVSRERWVVNALEALGFSAETMESHTAETGPASVDYMYPITILKRHCEAISSDASLSGEQKRKALAENAMHTAVRMIIESQLSALAEGTASETIRDVASQSWKWPVSALAFVDAIQMMNAGVTALGLGTRLPFRLNRCGAAKTGVKRHENDLGGGRNRSFKPGSPAAFALEYCLALNDSRQANLGASDLEKADWAAAVERIERGIRERTLCNPRTDGDPEDPGDGHFLSYYWHLKAALLPEFPAAASDASSGPDSAINAWVDAAVARARLICRNDWDNYKGWPTCVANRVCYDPNSKMRSAKDAVREKLAEGMDKLR